MKPEKVTPRKTRIETRPCKVCLRPFDSKRSQCPMCKTWNTSMLMAGTTGTKLLSQVKRRTNTRIFTKYLDRALQGPGGPGMVDTSVLLLGGAPGAGKSTICLQVLSEACSRLNREGLYIGMEESEEEILDRAIRLDVRLDLVRIYPMGASTDIGDEIAKAKPCMLIVDSIPGLTGGDPQAAVDMCTNLKAFSVLHKFPTIVIDHVTKQDEFAGFMALEHAVDATATFFAIETDGDRKEENWIRELKVLKNRNGPSHQSTFYEMGETGLSLCELETD